MAELLIKAADHTLADPGRDRAECYKKGDAVVAMPDGHPWGAAEGPPTFVVVRVPDLDLATARARIESWDYVYDFAVLQRSVPQDGWRFRVVSTEARAADNAGAPKRDDLAAFFGAWGAAYVRQDADGVVLDWAITDGMQSPAFLGADPASVGVTITETAYNETTGVHGFTVDWSAATDVAKMAIQVVRRLTNLGAAVVGEVGATSGDFTIAREIVKDAFTDDIKQARSMYKRARYSLPAADVDAVLAAGGTWDTDRATLLAHLIDHRAG